MHNYKTVGVEQDIFTIEVRLTSKCNYNCYYCTDLHYNKVPFVIHNVKHICELINTAYEHLNKPIYMYIYGGEPTIYPYLFDYIDGLFEGVNKNVKFTFDIQSNLALKNDWWEKFCKRYADNNQTMKVCGSYHNTQTNISTFIKKAIILKKYGMLNMLSFMYNSKKDVMKDFKFATKVIGTDHCEVCPLIDSKVSQPIESDIAEVSYIEKNEDINELKQHSFFFDDTIPVDNQKRSRFSFWLENDNTFTGYRCNAPLDRIVVDWDGSSFTCESHLFSDTPPVFNINNDNNYTEYFSNLKPTICKFEKCFFNIESKKINIGNKVSKLSKLSKENSTERKIC